MRQPALVSVLLLVATAVVAQPHFVQHHTVAAIPHVQRGRFIMMKGGSIDTTVAPSFTDDHNHARIFGTLHMQRREEPEGGHPQLYLVHMKEPVTAEAKSKVEEVTGTKLGAYVPQNTFVIYATEEVAQKALTAPNVLWVGDFLPEYKYNAETIEKLRARAARSAEEAGSVRDLELSFVVTLAEDPTRTKSDCAATAREWESELNTMLSNSALLRRFAVHATTSSKNIIRVSLTQRAKATASSTAAALVDINNWLADRWEVHWIEPKAKHLPFNHWATWVVQTGQDNVTTLTTNGLDGNGQLFGCADTGIDWDNCFFFDPNVSVPFDNTNPNHRKIFAYLTTYGDNYDNFNHGTPCTGTVAGLALDSSPATMAYASVYNGIAYNSKIAFVDINSGGEAYTPPDDFYDNLYPRTFDIGAQVNLYAWGSSATWYTTQEQATDKYHYDNQQFLAIFAAGNDGTAQSINSPADSKNCLTVGSSTNAYGNLIQRRSTQDFLVVLNNLVSEVCNSSVTSLFDSSLFCASFGSTAPCPSIKTQACSAFSLVGGPDTVCCANSYASLLCCPSVVVNNIVNNPILFDFSVGTTSSSRGPSFDGRIKPDVVAPGDRIISAQSDMQPATYNCGIYPATNDAVTPVSGTSFAAGAATGAAVLARQYFSDGYFPFGVRTPGSGFEPTGALIKAVLINSGQPLYVLDTTGNSNFIKPKLPDYNQGFGRIQLDQTLYFPGSSFKLNVEDGVNIVVGTGETVRSCLQVLNDSVPLKITLVWSDPAAALGAGIALVNNLDLLVIDSTGKEYRSNFGDVFDALNNVEQVTIDHPNPDQYIILVHGLNVPGSTKQQYALVSTGQFAVLSSCNNVCPNGCSLKGTCNNGVCQCTSPFVGVDCSLTPCPKNCSGNGYCDGTGNCVCGTGWYGADCSTPTPPAPPPASSNVTVVISNNGTSSGGDVSKGVTIGVAIAGFFLGLLPALVVGVFLGRKWTRDKILKSIPTVQDDEPMVEQPLVDGGASSSQPFQSSLPPDQAWTSWASKA